MKVLCVMWYDENIKEYADINFNINMIYCKKNNIELIRCDKKRYIDRNTTWERIPLILENIKNYDYVIWIDADAFFYINGRNILDIINNHPSYDFIFSKDINVVINTGIFIVKNSEYSINFLKLWGYNNTLLKLNPHPYWADNGVIIFMYNNNILDIKNKSVVMYYGVLQHFYNYEFDLISRFKPLIYHLAGRDYKTRVSESQKYYKEICNDL
jgi:hypothetical protein